VRGRGTAEGGGGGGRLLDADEPTLDRFVVRNISRRKTRMRFVPSISPATRA